MLSGALLSVESNQFFFAEENTGGENKQSVFGKEIFPFISNPYFNSFHGKQVSRQNYTLLEQKGMFFDIFINC